MVICSSLEEAGSGLKIGTHDGKFHCDEALAVAMLKFLPKWRTAAVVRSRNPEVLAACDIIVDVGGQYDPDGGVFDHHQKGFDGVLPGYNTKLSSAGLVYQHFGREVLGELTRDAEWPAHVAEVVYHKVYKDFLEAIDGIDNGVDVAGGAELKYRVTTDLSARVSRLFPAWNEPQPEALVHECFRDAVLLTGGELLERARGLAGSWWPARSVVESALDAAQSDGRIMVLESGGVPWQTHVFDIEAERQTPAAARLLFALYQDQSGKWRVQAVPEAEGSFESRLKLAEPWRGLRDAALSAALGEVEGGGAVFVHAAGFIGGHSTKAGALGMALKTIELAGL